MFKLFSLDFEVPLSTTSVALFDERLLHLPTSLSYLAKNPFLIDDESPFVAFLLEVITGTPQEKWGILHLMLKRNV